MAVISIIPFLGVLYAVFTTVRVFLTKVPGPWYTNITSLILKYHEFSGSRRTWIHSLHQRYGPVVRLAPNECSFANFEGMKEIYQSGGSGYDKTEFYDLFKQFDYRTMFSTLKKQDHAQRKRLFADRYAMTNIVRPEIVQGIETRAESVLSKCKESMGGYLDVYVTLHCYALDCASHFLFSPMGTDTLNNPDDMVLIQELTYNNSLKQRWLEYYAPTLSALMFSLRGRNATISKDYVIKQSQQTTPNEATLISRLQSRSDTLQNIQMAAECMDHMSAGIDTTGDGLCFLMHELSLPRSQHVQQRLREEFIQNPNARLDMLPYLDAVIKEGLRLFPPIPMSLPRCVPEGGRFISGYNIPGGSVVSCQAFSMHRLDESLFPDPEIYNPERWIEEKGLVDRNRMFFSFAAGGRGCIGRHLATIEMKTLLKEIYSNFTTSVALEMEGDMSIDDQIIASRPKDQTCLLKFTLY
ncbi:putative sterigmatocystin biosynthesis P450 monooxygenase [Lachnellula occidentalis]|uniref:Putative sterigmatocystin biosynthesis P450 monooxygenase n=1 Tax=Lachnellula occidentalis TaxID=215460 RepID=A0A8H8RQM8_9HELO|nr:putative sterigmatocystin biosynthesis P450 monooxygenase [Lachnellula occidentalis]